MKKIFLIVILLLFFFSFKSFAAVDGKGQIQLSENVINSFIRYILGDVGTSKSLLNVPGTFWITIDGSKSFWWYNPHGGDGVSNSSKERAKCEEATGQSCSRFARGRYVRWDNGINPKGKAAKFSSKLSESEVRAKLTKLGFYNNDSLETTTTPKITKKIDSKKYKKDVVYFNKCASKYTDKKDYHDSFEIDLEKDTIYMEFFGTGEVYESRIKIALNNDNFIQTVIDEYGNDSYVRYRFSKKNDEVTSFFFKDKKGKIKDDQYILICDDIIGTLKNKNKKPKIVKNNESTIDKDIVKKLKDLKELLDSEVLTKEEFEKAKKKLLN